MSMMAWGYITKEDLLSSNDDVVVIAQLFIFVGGLIQGPREIWDPIQSSYEVRLYLDLCVPHSLPMGALGLLLLQPKLHSSITLVDVLLLTTCLAAPLLLCPPWNIIAQQTKQMLILQLHSV